MEEYKYKKLLVTKPFLIFNKDNLFITSFEIGYALCRDHELCTINDDTIYDNQYNDDDNTENERILIDPLNPEYILLKNFSLIYSTSTVAALIYSYDILKKSEYNNLNTDNYFRFPILKNATTNKDDT